MSKASKKAVGSLLLSACCFVAGILFTLVWTSLTGSSTASPKNTQTLFTNSTATPASFQTGSLSRADLVIAIPCSLARLPLVEASRGWRQGTRTFVALESESAVDAALQSFKDGMAAAEETVGIYADLPEGPPAWHKPGDARATMAPFLANHSLGADSYKWMLYGDDDTVFYLDNVLRMLQHLDHTMPYFITDHIWFLKSLTEELDDNRMHPARSAPRCLPCEYKDPLQSSTMQNEFHAPQGCPCTKAFLCSHDNLGVFGGADICNVKQHNWYFGHGGAGMIVSSGLMKLASFEAVKQFVDTAMQGDPATTVMSGDGVFGQVMHTVMQIMPTDPGYGYYRPHIQLFDPAWREDEPPGSTGKHPLAVLNRLELALSNLCSDECEDLLQHFLAVHLGARDATEDLGMQEVLSSMKNSSSLGADDKLKAAAFLHQQFARTLADYSRARHITHGNVPWFGMSLPDRT